ncbi:hypothetical protein [Tumebacillus flagellatus]|uniref:Peptidase C-terminal archaeal/bacterial domain-containing protein n=1 Tax=Tumebacillus flagellatus TaxID=1157490 RepID=A0A074MAR8_9BACL|nr:hypothetical protein [Tumebacillus flagellatus]KEO83012.1 hypothetical protein EL26_12035 [Tumebacillus flagellatus]
MKKFATLFSALALTVMLVPTASSASVSTEDIKMESEPNDTMSSATRIDSVSQRMGTISTADDVDWYFLTIGSLQTSPTATFTLSNIPSGKDYDLMVYDQNNKLVGISTNAGNTDETVKFPIVPGATYYAKVYSYSGYSASSYYLLSLNYN